MSFKDIKGQDRVIGILKAYWQDDKLKGGYLFSGPDSIGKKLVAKTLAKALNCDLNSFQPCDKCPSCIKIGNNMHPDVHIIEEGDDEIKIEYIRQLQREANFKAYEGKRKVFIIDNAHNFNAESSNAMLKTLEEPPGDTLIILITDKPALLFKTIISRCKILKFSASKRQELTESLKKDYSFDKETAHFLAYFSEGRLGRALSFKDPNLIKEKNNAIDSFAFTNRLNLGKLPISDKDEIRRYLNIIATWFRDIYFIKVGMPHSEIINSDRKDDLLKIMHRFTFADLDAILAAISNTITGLDQNINVRLLLHNLGAQICKG